jgi:O-antigen/teichoic acid export membrane protein
MTLGLRRRWRQFHAVSPSGSNVIVSAGTNVLVAGLGLLSGPLAARLLGPAARGELAAIQNLFWLIALLAMLGLPEAAIYFTARQPEHAGRVLATGICLPLLTTPIFFLLMYPVVPFVLGPQPLFIKDAARWILLAIPLYASVAVGTFTVRGTNRLTYWNLLRLLPGTAWLLFLTGAWIWGEHNPVSIAVGYLAVLGSVMIPTLWIAKKLTQSSYLPSKSLVKPMLSYGLPLAGAGIPQTLNLRLDQILIGAFLPPYQLGLYVVAVAWSTAVFITPNAIGNVLFPKIASGMTSLAERARTLTQGVRVGILTSGAVAVLLLGLTPYAIPLFFGRAFASAVPVGFVLILAAMLCGLNVIFEETLRGLGDTAGVFWGETIGLVVTALSLALLLRPLGIMGAGAASVLGYGTTCGVLVRRICRSADCSLSNLLLPRGADLRLIALRVQGWCVVANQEAK